MKINYEKLVERLCKAHGMDPVWDLNVVWDFDSTPNPKPLKMYSLSVLDEETRHFFMLVSKRSWNHNVLYHRGQTPNQVSKAILDDLASLRFAFVPWVASVRKKDLTEPPVEGLFTFDSLEELDLKLSLLGH